MLFWFESKQLSKYLVWKCNLQETPPEDLLYLYFSVHLDLFSLFSVLVRIESPLFTKYFKSEKCRGRLSPIKHIVYAIRELPSTALSFGANSPKMIKINIICNLKYCEQQRRFSPGFRSGSLQIQIAEQQGSVNIKHSALH